MSSPQDHEIQESSLKQKKRTSPFLIILSTIGVLTIAFILLIIGLFAFIFYKASSNLSVSQINFKNFMAEKNYDHPHFAGLKIHDEITIDNATELRESIKRIKDCETAKGVFLDVNSPGGAVVPSQILYDEIKLLRKVKPVVVYVTEYAASGSYYAIAPANKIVATRGSFIGSIGGLAMTFDIVGLLNKFNIKSKTFTTGSLKDAGSYLRKMTLDDEKYLKALLEEAKEQFVQDIKDVRDIAPSSLNYLSDGRVVHGSLARSFNLIDKLGTYEEALHELTILTKESKPLPVESYEKSKVNIKDMKHFLFEQMQSSLETALEKVLLNTSNKAHIVYK